MTTRPAERRFTLFDAVVLVAATAVAAALGRESWPFLLELGPFEAVTNWLYVLVLAPALVVPGLFSWSLAVFLLGLRPPRPRFRRLARQPGVVACGLASLMLAVGGAFFLSILPIRERPSADEEFTTLVLVRLIDPVGGAVAAAWLTLILTRRWRPDRGWIDRAGRILGAGWVLLFLFVFWFQIYLGEFWPMKPVPIPLPHYYRDLYPTPSPGPQRLLPPLPGPERSPFDLEAPTPSTKDEAKP